MIKTLKEFRYSHYFYVFGVDDMALATVIGAVVAGVAAVGSSIATNKANKDAVDSTNEQNRELTERAWERDDMQLQRARQDAEKAGFSPLAALSSNLTNSSPATMQAPSYDFSGVGQGIGEIAKAPAQAKQAKTQRDMQRAQIAQVHEQSRGLRLDNLLKQSTFRNNVMKNSYETMKLIEEARNQKLSNAQLAAILRANGYTAEQAKQLSGIDNVPIHTGEAASENLTKSQTELNKANTSFAYTQINDINSMRQYYQDELRWNTQLAHIQADKDAKLNHYWYDALPKDSPSIRFKKLNMSTGNLEDDYIPTAGRSRFEAMEEYDRKYAQLMTDIQVYQNNHDNAVDWTNAIWSNLNGTINAASSFFMPSTTTYQTYTYDGKGHLSSSTNRQTHGK